MFLKQKVDYRMHSRRKCTNSRIHNKIVTHRCKKDKATQSHADVHHNKRINDGHSSTITRLHNDWQLNTRPTTASTIYKNQLIRSSKWLRTVSSIYTMQVTVITNTNGQRFCLSQTHFKMQ